MKFKNLKRLPHIARAVRKPGKARSEQLQGDEQLKS